MNHDPTDPTLGRALRAYSRSLRQVRPSAALDARLAASIREHAGVRSVRPLWRRPMPWIVAAGSVAVIAAGVALLLVRTAPPESTSFAQATDQPGVRPAQAIDKPSALSAHAIGNSGVPQAPMTDASGPAPHASSSTAPARNTGDRVAISSGQYSLWPTEAAVFRVKASLGGGAESVPGERQYWVDVRVANDGSMRIVRVLPANPEE